MGGKCDKDRLEPASRPISGLLANASVQDLFAATGEMATLMRATGWPKPRLGLVENWPRSLHTMLGVILDSRRWYRERVPFFPNDIRVSPVHFRLLEIIS